jgi:hypothetical protein
MAFLEEFKFIGRLGEFTAYKRWDSDKTILRRKGGGSRMKIMTSEKCKRTRENMAEFGGRSRVASWVRRAMWSQRALADYNFIGSINALIKPVQDLDTEGLRGRRAIRLSASPRMLEGFSLNRGTTFDMMVQNTVYHTISRQTRSATVDLPGLLPGINFTPRVEQIEMGIVPDAAYNGKRYESAEWYQRPITKQASTPWFLTQEGAPASTLEVSIPFVPADDGYTLVLSIGMCFGQPGGGGVVKPVRRVGAAKILATA